MAGRSLPHFSFISLSIIFTPLPDLATRSMPRTTHKPGLSGYFADSTLFLYFQSDPGATCLLTNSLFDKIIGPGMKDHSLDSCFMDPAGFRLLIKQCFEEGPAVHTATLLMKTATGGLIPVRWEFSLYETGEQNGGFVQGIGITEHAMATIPVINGTSATALASRYKAYEQSQEGLWRFESLVPVAANADPDSIIAHWRRNSYLAECNDKMARMYGYEKAGHLIGTKLEQLLDFSDKERISNLYRFIQNGFRPMLVETKEFDRYGHARYFLNSMEGIVENGMLSTVWGTQHDITDQRLAEEKLEKSELFYRNLIAESLDGILLTDEQGLISFVSPSVTNILGHQPEELKGRMVFDYVYPGDREEAVTAFMNEVNMRPAVKFINVRLVKKDGTYTWCMVRGHNMLHNPYVGKIIVYFTDDTKRKQMEDRLRESEERFRNMIHNLKMGIILLDQHGITLIHNQAALDMLGLSSGQLKDSEPIDPRWHAVREDGSDFPPADHPAPLAIRTGQPVRDVVMGIYRPAFNDPVWLLVNADPLFDETGKLVQVVCSMADITEQRKLSQQLIEQEIQKQKWITQATIDGQEKERLEIGKELHDNINQHLNTTRLYLEVAGEKATGQVQEMISLAHKNLATIVNEIRWLSQSLVPPTLGDIGLVESIQDLCDSLRRTHSFRIEFQHRRFSEAGLQENLKLMVFRIIQEQVSNIIRHARASTIRIQLQSDAENIVFSVEDDGQGFDSQRYKKGMGLNNISNRAALFGGTADIKSSPGKGCSVTVTIPLEGLAEQ